MIEDISLQTCPKNDSWGQLLFTVDVAILLVSTLTEHTFSNVIPASETCW